MKKAKKVLILLTTLALTFCMTGVSFAQTHSFNGACSYDGKTISGDFTSDTFAASQSQLEPGDDLEYTRRISMEHPCYYVKNSVVKHDCATNTGSNVAQDSIDRLKNYTYAYRNEFYNFKSEGLRGLAYWAVRLGCHILRIAVSGESEKKKRFMALFKGTLMGFFYNPTIDIV